MEKANSEGYDMMKKVFFPSIPALAQDLWVFIELAISIAAFGIGIVGTDFPLEVNVVFQIIYLVLASVAMVLALIDGFIYFFQMGSCARGIRVLASYCKKRKREKEGYEEEEEEDDEEEEEKSRCGMSAQTRETFNTWFELVRNLTNEFLVYPILVFDMFAIISEGENGTYLPEPSDAQAARKQTDFGFLVIGSFYLILAVYIMRVVMVFGTLLSLIRLPSSKEASGTEKDTSLLIKFCIHIIGQIAVHFVIIVVLWAKIRNENQPLPDMSSNSTMSMPTNSTIMNSTVTMMDTTTISTTMMTNATNATAEEDDSDAVIRASAFLITACVMGGALPLIGVTAFFIVNYFWMREFSIGFWLNMLSMLQGASFADAVFGGEGLAPADEQANQFLDDAGFDNVKVQITKLQEQTFWTKFFYPTKVPVVALCGVLYDLALVSFVATLMLTNDENGVRLVVFQEDDFLTSAFVISTSVIIIANLHVLLLLNFLLLVVVVVGILAAMYSVTFLPLLLVLYLPSIGFIGYYFLFKDSAGKLKKTNQTDREDAAYALESLGSDQDFKFYGKEKRKAAARKPETVVMDTDISGKESPLLIVNAALNNDSYA